MKRRPRPAADPPPPSHAWFVDLVDAVVQPHGYVITLEGAKARAAEADGGTLKWEIVDYYAGELAVGRRGIWLIDRRPVGERMYAGRAPMPVNGVNGAAGR